MYNLFISHSWNYSDAYGKLISLLNADPYFKYRNYSVPKDDPIHNAPYQWQLKEAIKAQMASASCILIMAGVYSTYSKWINIEIELAKSGFSVPKRIIAIEPWGSEKTSTVVKPKNVDVSSSVETMEEPPINIREKKLWFRDNIMVLLENFTPIEKDKLDSYKEQNRNGNSPNIIEASRLNKLKSGSQAGYVQNQFDVLGIEKINENNIDIINKINEESMVDGVTLKYIEICIEECLHNAKEEIDNYLLSYPDGINADVILRIMDYNTTKEQDKEYILDMLDSTLNIEQWSARMQYRLFSHDMETSSVNNYKEIYKGILKDSLFLKEPEVSILLLEEEYVEFDNQRSIIKAYISLNSECKEVYLNEHLEVLDIRD